MVVTSAGRPIAGSLHTGPYACTKLPRFRVAGPKVLRPGNVDIYNFAFDHVLLGYRYGSYPAILVVTADPILIHTYPPKKRATDDARGTVARLPRPQLPLKRLKRYLP